MNNTIYLGNALETLKTLPSCSIDCCVTSPPYYGLRDYGVENQIGLEDSPEGYIEKLVEIFEQVRRVLKKDGTLWLNIADSYAGSGKGRNKDGSFNEKSTNFESEGQRNSKLSKTKASNCKPKNLIGIPWLLALALRNSGWYLRQDIIWYKPNCMPESVTDRCTKSHEYIFLLSKSSKYYFDYEAIKEPAVGFDTSSPRGSKGSLTPNSGRRKGNSKTFRGSGAYVKNQSFDNSNTIERTSHGNMPNTIGLRRKRDVWSVSTQGFSDAHFATFPEKLIEPCILAGCPAGGVVLDPFLGSGTTAVVAQRLGRNYVGIELNPSYVELAKARFTEKKG